MFKTVKIFLIRHAEPNLKADTIPKKNSSIKIPKTECLQRLIKTIPKDCRLICSPLTRAIQTFKALEKLGLTFKSFETRTDFSEQNLGIIEGLNYESAWNMLSNLKLHNWAFFNATFKPVNGESFEQLTKRVVNDLKAVLHEKKSENLVIVSHSGVIRSIVGSALSLDTNAMLALKFDHLSLSFLEYSDQKFLGGQYQIHFLNRIFN